MVYLLQLVQGGVDAVDLVKVFIEIYVACSQL